MTKYILPLFIIALTACGQAEESANDSKEKENNPADSLAIEPVTGMENPPKLEVDPYLTDVSRVIAGLPVNGNDSVLLAIQQKDFYKAYQEFTKETFDKVRDNMLNPVKEWTAAHNIGDPRKGHTCYYPLSGPDFMFATTFYPRASNYVLMGLERRGTLPDFNTMDDADLKKYFNGLKHSMKYINSRGYFVTSHMSGDFSKDHLDGVTHMMLYMMAHTGHEILKVEDGYLNSDGTLTRIDEHAESPEGAVRIKVIECTSDGINKKSVHFFNFNVVDENWAKHPEVETFIANFPNKSAFMKAAQCALFNGNFSSIRNLVLSCDRIIQDDSGVPYRFLSDTTKFETELYGTYNQVISDLSWCLQKDLMRDLQEKGDTEDLPFKISYNGNYGKGIIIFAVKK